MRLVVLLLAPLGHMGLLPAPMQLAWLRALRDEMPPMHPGLPEVLLEIAKLEARNG